MIRLVQLFDAAGDRRVALAGEDAGALRLIDGYARVYDLALAAIRAGTPLAAFVHARLSPEQIDYDLLITERRLLPPLDHPDPARCVVSLTGLTHLGSATSRDQMHAAVAAGNATDTMRMFQIGLEGGKPAHGAIGAQPEWAYKGDGRCVVAPEQPLTQPGFADDGGEEAEIAGLYVIDDDGNPWRVGYALGNEFNWSNIDERHQFAASGLVFLPAHFEASTTIRYNSGRPFSAIVGTDVNKDGTTRDRPVIDGVEQIRNTYRNKGYSEVDLRLQRGFSAGGSRRAIISLELFNLFNAANVEIGSANMVYGAGTTLQNGQLVTTTPPANFGRITDANGNYLLNSTLRTAPFQAQIGIRYQF